jgi:hypothetical protein
VYRGFYYSLLGYAKLSRNEVEAWDKWVDGQPRQRQQSKALIAQTRAVGPSRLCKIFWPEETPREMLSDEQVLRAKIQPIRTDNVSHRKKSVHFSTTANGLTSGMQVLLKSRSQSMSLSPMSNPSSRRRGKLNFTTLQSRLRKMPALIITGLPAAVWTIPIRR